MECDLTLSGIDVVIADGGQDANPSNSEESSTTSSTVNTPIENVNRTFAKSLAQGNQTGSQSEPANESAKKNEDKISDSSQGNKSDAKSLVSNSSQSTLTDGGADTNLKGNKDLLSSLPWNSAKRITSSLPIDKTIRPGEFVLRALFSEFALLAEKKIDTVLSQDAAEKPLNKLLQRGEDPIFDQLLSGIVGFSTDFLIQ